MIKKFSIIISLGCILSNASSTLDCMAYLVSGFCGISTRPVRNAVPQQGIANDIEAQRGSEPNMPAHLQEAPQEDADIAAAIAESIISAEEAKKRAFLAFIQKEQIQEVERASAAIEQELRDAEYAAQVQLELDTENPQQQETGAEIQVEVDLEEPEVEPEVTPEQEDQRATEAAQEALLHAREEEELRRAEEELHRTAEQQEASRLEKILFDRPGQFLETIRDMETVKEIIRIRVEQMLHLHSQGDIQGISSVLKMLRTLLGKIERIESMTEFSTLNCSIAQLMAVIHVRHSDLIKKRIEEFGQAAHAALDAVIKTRR